MTKSKKSRHGGAREGAGAPLKDENAGPRKMWSGRLHPDTVKILMQRSAPDLSQADIVDEAVHAWNRRNYP
jgi:hypothetical protein